MTPEARAVARDVTVRLNRIPPEARGFSQGDPATIISAHRLHRALDALDRLPSPLTQLRAREAARLLLACVHHVWLDYGGQGGGTLETDPSGDRLGRLKDVCTGLGGESEAAHGRMHIYAGGGGRLPNFEQRPARNPNNYAPGTGSEGIPARGGPR